ncbi:uncharacterized protein LOC134217292 [Armigeres subalbatus]|uniref:uncharacterized protein LOC134217292 n=1 Tax=Armigeres subalbatus TaxID=124917 RepID=UPI002ED08248
MLQLNYIYENSRRRKSLQILLERTEFTKVSQRFQEPEYTSHIGSNYYKNDEMIGVSHSYKAALYERRSSRKTASRRSNINDLITAAISAEADLRVDVYGNFGFDAGSLCAGQIWRICSLFRPKKVTGNDETRLM